MFVYRIEHPDTNLGPYVHRGTRGKAMGKDFYKFRDKMAEAHLDNYHPIRRYEGFMSACISLRRLSEWFAGYTPYLEGYGFVIRRYKIEKEEYNDKWYSAYLEPDSGGQVLILRQETRVATLPLSRLSRY